MSAPATRSFAMLFAMNNDAPTPHDPQSGRVPGRDAAGFRPGPLPTPIRGVDCYRCKVQMVHMGTRDFHEGKRWGMLGDIGEFFVNKQRFDVYSCPRCGLVEFFIDGVGDSARGEH